LRFSDLEIIFCGSLAKNKFVNSLILIIRARELEVIFCTFSKLQIDFCIFPAEINLAKGLSRLSGLAENNFVNTLIQWASRPATQPLPC
jgi:hypothetical protein